MSSPPRGWVDTRLGELIDGFDAGRNLAAHGRPATENEYGVLKVSAVSWGSFRADENKALFSGDEPKPHEIVRKGDLLISRANTTQLVGAVVRVGENHPRLMLPDKILRIRVRESVADPSFLMHALRLPSVRDLFESTATGTSDSMRNLSQPKIEDAPVSLPPLNEQRRIVAKLESLQARSRRAREALDAVPPLLEKFRQSVLGAAFRGDLTKDWRAKHADVEPATELLKRIRIERRKKWEEAELAKMQAKGKTPADDRWKAKYKEPEPVDASGLPELPEGWCWATLDELAWDSSYGTSVKCDVFPKGLPVLRIPNVSGGEIDTSDLKYATVDPDLHPSELLTRADLLLIRTNGSRDLVGNGALIDSVGEGFFFASYLIRFRIVQIACLPSLVATVLKTPAVRDRVMADSATSAGQYNVSMSKLAALPIPIPPEDEMLTLVQRTDDQVRGVDRMRTRLLNMRTALETLGSSVLAKAFRGDLVPQDPNDEPAEALLARVRSADSSTEMRKPRRRRSEAAE